MTDEQQAILEKFGFRLENGQVKHSKLGIVKEEEEFESFSNLEELREHVKEMLRNQCQWKRADQ